MEPIRQRRRCKRHGFDPWVAQTPEEEWQPTPGFLPGEPHGQRRPVGYGPRGHKEPDTTGLIRAQTEFSKKARRESKGMPVGQGATNCSILPAVSITAPATEKSERCQSPTCS